MENLSTKMAIKATNLCKEYGNLTALRDFNIEIPKGSFFGLLGPNGAGKSTFINILAGLTKKTSGTVKVLGHDIHEKPKLTAHLLGIVPQEIVFDPFFTVRESIEIYSNYYSIPKNERRTDEIIESLGLTEKAHSKPRKLSGGMKRRLLIAKALVHSPEILILDEPTAGVDIELRKQLWKYIKKLNEAGTTIILTTHYLEEAESLCDQIAIINEGRIIKSDKKENLMHLLDLKKVKVLFNSKILELPQNLKEICTSATTSNNELFLEFTPRTTSFARILEILNKMPGEIKDLKTNEPNLEQIFSHLINS